MPSSRFLDGPVLSTCDMLSSINERALTHPMNFAAGVATSRLGDAARWARSVAQRKTERVRHPAPGARRLGPPGRRVADAWVEVDDQRILDAEDGVRIEVGATGHEQLRDQSPVARRRDHEMQVRST